jgi:23S rRNA (uridine2552-2'-O)-methyltransferase
MTGRFIVQDKYFHKAKEMGYRARSAFKLQEIQDQFHLVKRGDSVLDLGAAPGSFMQVLLKWVGESGRVVGVDLQMIEDFGDLRAQTFVADVFDEAALAAVISGTFDVITSDLAPKTSGIKDADTYHSAELARQALELAGRWLKPGGAMVVKIFEGEDFALTIKAYKQAFKQVKCFTPRACRDTSYETYIVAVGKNPLLKKR